MIDWTRVLELRDEVGAEDFNEVVDLFLDEVQEVIMRLDDNLPPAQVEADLHFLKGSALSLGFAAFSDLCETGEKKASGGENLTDVLPRLRDCYAKSRQIFLNDLPQKLTAPAV
ncbi:Hpt domain-containing protein [Sulfitobacter sp. S0837]|uniref:Hpt domain-containing protein n=1 Tax=Sulfitobacter maritimus TaxID=2741719 RepID=UPI0015825BA1|nr:Hpt domain-containing protein [Sulfitobacter maritimus]NUH66921.1 Hpt domain-containing protein [Sulfitobacter maritimus]